MKIQEASNKNYMLTGKHNTQIKTIKEILNQTNAAEKSVQIEISVEGYESYRNNLSNLEGYTQQQIPNRENSEMIEKSVLNDERIYSELRNLMDKFANEEPDKTSDGYIKALFNAYTTMYNEIRIGYKDGSRDLRANECQNGKQTSPQITEEKELADLNEAFTRHSEFLEMRTKGTAEGKEALDAYRQVIAKLSGHRKPILDEEEPSEPFIKSEDIEETLKKGRRQFLERYSSYRNLEDFNKGVTEILFTMIPNNAV